MPCAWLQYIVGSFLVGLLIQSFPARVLAQSPGSEAAPTVLQPIVTTATRSERSLASLASKDCRPFAIMKPLARAPVPPERGTRE